MLTLGIRYLNGWVMATHPANREIPEWPPHPDRVFMALAAAHFETDGDVAERQILEWIEALGPPTLDCSGADYRTTVTTFVPVNDSASPISKKGKPLMESQSMAVGRDRQARQFPVAVPQSDEVRLSWTNPVANAEQSQTLSALCAKVTHIGHSASMVQMWVVDDTVDTAEKNNTAAGPELFRMTLEPQAIGRFRLRIPGPGRLHDLEARYNMADVEAYSAMQQKLTESGLKPAKKKEIQAEIKERFGDQVPESRRPEPALWSGYDQLQIENPDQGIHATHFANLIVLQQVGGRRFGVESTLQLTQALRNTVMKKSGVQPVPDWLSGHQPDGRPAERELGHMAFIPLPHVGWKHADGHLLGMALVPPRDVDRQDLAAALHGVLFDDNGEAAPMTLTLGKAGECVVKVVDGSESQAAFDPVTWTQASTRWATVTPIALDRHAKGDHPWDEIVEMIERACDRIGLPKPVDIIPAPVSMFIGAPTSGEMPRITRKTGGQIRQTHAILTFGENVSGPMLLGAGRYRGYGLCRPLVARKE